MLEKYHIKGRIEAGCDEAGRGCLAGPVFAAAVILPENIKIAGLDDSKKLSEKKRILLRSEIKEKALSYAVASVSPKEIDEINILNASFLAMHRAIDQLSITPEALLIDGNRFNRYKKIPHECMIKGDGRFLSIAAASILAKTYRDEYMEKIHLEHPEFDWNKNKGYPTKKHRDIIQQIGATKYHRQSFNLIDKQYKLDV